MPTQPHYTSPARLPATASLPFIPSLTERSGNHGIRVSAVFVGSVVPLQCLTPLRGRLNLRFLQSCKSAEVSFHQPHLGSTRRGVRALHACRQHVGRIPEASVKRVYRALV